MESKFKVGIKVKDKSGTEDDEKVGVIIAEIMWLGLNGKPIERHKDAPKWAILFDNEKETKYKREEDLEII